MELTVIIYRAIYGSYSSQFHFLQLCHFYTLHYADKASALSNRLKFPQNTTQLHLLKHKFQNFPGGYAPRSPQNEHGASHTMHLYNHEQICIN